MRPWISFVGSNSAPDCQRRFGQRTQLTHCVYEWRRTAAIHRYRSLTSGQDRWFLQQDERTSGTRVSMLPDAVGDDRLPKRLLLGLGNTWQTQTRPSERQR